MQSHKYSLSNKNSELHLLRKTVQCKLVLHLRQSKFLNYVTSQTH